MMGLIRLWRSLNKKDSLKKYNMFFYVYPSFRTFFHRSGFFRIGDGFLADPDPDSKITV